MDIINNIVSVLFGKENTDDIDNISDSIDKVSDVSDKDSYEVSNDSDIKNIKLDCRKKLRTQKQIQSYQSNFSKRWNQTKYKPINDQSPIVCMKQAPSIYDKIFS